MRSKADIAADYVGRKIAILSDTLDSGIAKAQLAQLRRGIGKKPGEIPELWGGFLMELPEDLMSQGSEPSASEWAIYTAMTIYAYHQQGNVQSVHSDELRLGKAVRQLVKTSEDEERVLRRFQCLATSANMEELSHYLRSMIGLFRSENISLDYIDLTKDLYYYQFENGAPKVRLKWGQDFYRMALKTRKEDEK